MGAVVHGSLGAMPPTEILQWLGGARKTGMLEVEHDRVVRRIHVRDGVIRSCGSDYAPTLLGQYLLSRGQISETELSEALAQQEGSGRNLGEILIAAGRLTAEELERFIAAKVEETVYGLFDLKDGTFRFESDAEPPAAIVETNLTVEHALLHGAKREDETRRMREVIPHDDIVLETTGVEPPAAVVASTIPRRMLDLVDGRRTVREIILHARLSGYVAHRLLAGLVRAGVLRVTDRPASAAPSIVASTPRAQLEADARERLAAGDPEAALSLLDEACRAHPSDAALCELRDEAESTWFAHLFGHVLGPRRIPEILRRPESCAPEESFLLSLVDGKNDVRALVWLAPMRALAVARALKSLVDSGAVSLREP
jgi:hypothetical protein